MRMPDTELFGLEAVNNPLGEGFRIHTSHGAVYEAVEDKEGVETRLYRRTEQAPEESQYWQPEEGSWRTTVRVPVDGRRDASQTFESVANRISKAYDVDIPVTGPGVTDPRPTYFDGDVLRTESEDGAYRVQYRDRGKNPRLTAGYEPWNPDNQDPYIVGGITGGTAGGLAALLGGAGLGDPVLFGSALAGFAVGGPAVALLGGAVPRLEAWWRAERLQQKYGAVDALAERPLLEQLNERNALERLLEEQTGVPERLEERYEDLSSEPLDELWDVLTELHFERFQARQGFTASAAFESYEEAARFTEVVSGAIPALPSRYREPSLYRSPELFRSMFDKLTFTADGETVELDDATTLIQNVYDQDAVADDVVDFLEEEHPALVQEIGRERTMRQQDDVHSVSPVGQRQALESGNGS